MPAAINTVSFLTPITGLHAGLLTLIYLALTLRVVRLRKAHRQPHGDGGHAALARAVRAHGHFAEYVPLALVLMLLLELARVPVAALHGYGLLLLASRLLNLAALLQAPEPLRWRFFAMVVTVLLLGGAALSLVLLWWRG